MITLSTDYHATFTWYLCVSIPITGLPSDTERWTLGAFKHKSRSDWRTQNGNYNPKEDTIGLLRREQAAIICRLRTGHCRLRAHLRRIHLSDTALCASTQADQTPAHISLDCPLFPAQRNQTRPQHASCRTAHCSQPRGTRPGQWEQTSTPSCGDRPLTWKTRPDS